MDIFINKNKWRHFNDVQMSDFIESVFLHYRKSGFPFFNTSSEYRDKELEKLCRYSGEIIVGDTVRQTMHGLGLAWSFHPHSFSVRSNGKLSPMDAFTDDAIFRKVIAKRIALGDNISDNGIRKMLKMYTGVQGVSNFRPTAAHAIYEKLMPAGGVAWDMSSGWGGRILGAYKAKIKYIGTDPATKTQEANKNLAKYLNFDCELHTVGSEDFIPDKHSLDLCFTSPPYFDCEKYSEDAGQSFIRYKSKEEWLNNYLYKTLTNCMYGLKPNGVLAVNIANVPTYKNLVDDFLIVATKVGFKHDATLKLNLSSAIGKNGFKSEPIFVMSK